MFINQLKNNQQVNIRKVSRWGENPRQVDLIEEVDPRKANRKGKVKKREGRVNRKRERRVDRKRVSLKIADLGLRDPDHKEEDQEVADLEETNREEVDRGEADQEMKEGGEYQIGIVYQGGAGLE